MAKLPEIQSRGSVTRGPQSSISAAEIADPYRQIANALEIVGDGFEKQAVVEADQEGQNAVYRDSSGNLQVDRRSGISASVRSYNAAASQGYTARMASDIRARGQALANEAKGNIDVFNTGYKAFRDQTLSLVPKQFRGAVMTMLDTEGPRFALGVSEQKRTSDLKEAEGNLKSEIQFLDDDMSALARAGGTGTDAYRQKQEQSRTLWSQLAENPDFTVGRKEADIAIARMESRHTSEAVLGTIDRTLQKGGLVEARKLAADFLTDDKIQLSPAERRQYSSLANERINGYVAQVKVDLKPVQEASKSIQERLKLGIGLDADDVDDTAQKLARGGDMAGAMELYSARSNAFIIQNFGLSDKNQQVVMAEKWMKGGGNVVDRIIGVESGGNATAKNPNSSATGAGQFIGSTWMTMMKQYRPDLVAGKSAAEVLAMRNDPQLSREMTGHYANENAEFLRNQGIKVTDGNVYLAHFLGPRGAAQVLKADPSGSVESVVGEGVVNANSFLRGKTNAQVIQWATAKMGGGGGYVAPEVLKVAQDTMTSNAKQLFSDIKSGTDRGFTPAVTDLNLLTRQLAVVNDSKFKTEVADYFSSQAAVAAFQNMAPADVESLMSTLRADASDGATVAQQQILQSLQASQEARTKAIDNDPIGYAASRGYAPPPPALDLAQPDSWQDTFQSLQRSVDVLQARGEVGNISALRPEMLSQVSRMLGTATPGESVQLLGSMAQNLRPDTYKATLAKLYSSGNRAAATAGVLVADNPAVAEGILRGQMLLKENPNLAPKKTDENTLSIDEKLPTQAFAAGQEVSRQFLLESATARYADLSHQAGDTSGALNETRMQQAITEVTGGVVEMNGYSVLVPRYGMTQREFDDRLSKLTDDDLAGMAVANGARIHASDIRDQARLRAVADGRYLVEFGSPSAPTYAMRQPSPGNYSGGDAFILDLRDK